MISRDQVIELYRLVLDRDPESAAVINQKRSAESLSGLAADMLVSDEFFKANKELLKRHIQAAPQED
jgi:hypothetical protein